jgi:hypothetical protein
VSSVICPGHKGPFKRIDKALSKFVEQEGTVHPDYQRHGCRMERVPAGRVLAAHTAQINKQRYKNLKI